MPLEVTLETPEIDKLKVGGFRKLVDKQIKRDLNESLILYSNALKTASTVTTGELRNSWITDPARKQADGSHVGKVGSAVIQATVIEEGARPHSPPEDAITLWLRRKFGTTNERALKLASIKLRNRIAGRIPGRPGGFQAKRTFSKAIFALRSRVNAIFRRGQAIVAKKVSS